MISDLSPADVAGLRKVITEDVVRQAPPQVRPLLTRVYEALQEDATDAAVDRLNAIAQDLARAPDLKGQLAGFLGATAEQLRDTVQPVEEAATDLKGHASRVTEAAQAVRERLADLPDEQAVALRAALDALDAGSLNEDILGMLGRVASLGASLGDTVEAASDDPGTPPAALAGLADLFESLVGDADGLGERAKALQGALDALREVAAQHADGADAQRAQLLLERARRAEREAAERGEQAPDDLWWAAFTVGEAAGDVDVVGQAGFRLIAAAVDAGDMEAVLDLARRRLAVADAAGDVGAGVIARLELGRGLSNLGRHEEAHAVLHEAVGIAEPTGHRRMIARTHLASAGALQLAGRNAEAERALRRLMVWFDEDMEGVEDLVARTAMGLAMALNDDPEQQTQRTQCLRLAASLGHELADPRIYVPSKVGLVFAANEAGDRALAVAHLVQGRLRAQDFGEGPAQAFTDALLVLQEEWGEEALAEALRVHRQGGP